MQRLYCFSHIKGTSHDPQLCNMCGKCPDLYLHPQATTSEFEAKLGFWEDSVSMQMMARVE